MIARSGSLSDRSNGFLSSWGERFVMRRVEITSGISRQKAGMRRLLLRFGHQKKGAVAIEFAMISPLFFGILLAILETGILFLHNTAMTEGVKEASRVIMTGQVANAGSASSKFAAFKTAFCDQTDWLIKCDSVRFDVRAFTVFGANMMKSPIVNGALDASRLAFDPGKPCQIVVVRAYYEMTAFTAFIRKDVSNLGSGNVLLAGSAAFKNEPYGTC
jgi:Flp pilus assembly protein TadG